jgi:hypothetical protein
MDTDLAQQFEPPRGARRKVNSVAVIHKRWLQTPSEDNPLIRFLEISNRIRRDDKDVF